MNSVRFFVFSAPPICFPLSVVSPSSVFIASGPRFGTTKGKILFIVVCLLFFLWHLLCHSFPCAGAWRLAAEGWQSTCDGTAEFKQSKEERWFFESENGRGIFQNLLIVVFFLRHSHSTLLFRIVSFPAEHNNRQGGTGPGKAGRIETGLMQAATATQDSTWG